MSIASGAVTWPPEFIQKWAPGLPYRSGTESAALLLTAYTVHRIWGAWAAAVVMVALYLGRQALQEGFETMVGMGNTSFLNRVGGGVLGIVCSRHNPWVGGFLAAHQMFQLIVQDWRITRADQQQSQLVRSLEAKNKELESIIAGLQGDNQRLEVVLDRLSTPSGSVQLVADLTRHLAAASGPSFATEEVSAHVAAIRHATEETNEVAKKLEEWAYALRKV